MPTEYTVVFDITQHTGRDLWFVGFGVLFMVIGAVAIVRTRGRPERSVRVASFGIFGFATLWTIGAGVGVLGGARRLAADLQAGRCSVVEGTVANFTPMPANGKGRESFDVNGVPFYYSEYEITPGFRQTAHEGGPIHDGLRVRIHYEGNDIALLEVGR